MEAISQFVIDAASSPWLYPIVFLLTVGDAFLVVLPSETVVVALGALAVSTGHPQLGVLIPTAATAAIVGDSLTYLVGRCIGVLRFTWMRRLRIVAVFGWAARALEKRAASVLLTARFVPFGRIAVNLTAGATGFPYRRFAGLTAIAGVGWAFYNVAVGALFGHLFGDNPIVAVAVSVVVAVGIGLGIDLITERRAMKRRRISNQDAVSQPATP